MLLSGRKNTVQLTPDGKALLQHTEQLLSIYPDMKFDMIPFSNHLKRLLRPGASYAISQFIMLSELTAFCNKNKCICVKRSTGNTEQIETSSLNNDFALGVIEGHWRCVVNLKSALIVLS
jgi:LysR family transcriptional regulator, transcriptional activator of the cysJI operon